MYRKDCIMCMKMRRRVCFRRLKSVALASILSDFLQLFGINIHRIKCRQDIDSTVLCNYVVKMDTFSDVLRLICFLWHDAPTDNVGRFITVCCLFCTIM